SLATASRISHRLGAAVVREVRAGGALDVGWLRTLVFRFRRENFGVGFRYDERVFCQVFEILSCDDLCFFKRSEPPLNLKMLVSSNTFDNSTVFYEQLKFTWLVWVAIAVKVGGEIDPPSGDLIT